MFHHFILFCSFIYLLTVGVSCHLFSLIYLSMQDLHSQLTQFEPRVSSMREIAEQVFAQSALNDTSTQLRSKLTLLSERVTSLLRICTQYMQLLSETLKSRGESDLLPSLDVPSSSGVCPVRSPRRSPHRSPHRSAGALSTEVESRTSFSYT